MCTSRMDKRFLWLQVIHTIEDVDGMKPENLGPTLRILDGKFFIKKRNTLKQHKKK